ncbi:MAG: hypothetical protein KC777_30270 [Cyanobacteria bacterium HKST-UBA02]|nr:hypothetical protein [Cyanobacteria bacterium HKST-UBA02]
MTKYSDLSLRTFEHAIASLESELPEAFIVHLRALLAAEQIDEIESLLAAIAQFEQSGPDDED